MINKRMIRFEKMQTYTQLFYVRNFCFSKPPGSAAGKYRAIDWALCNSVLKSKQAEIVRVYKKKEFSEVFRLQKNITRSFAARALAVRKVSSNKGKNTPGIDKVVWSTGEQKYEAIKSLRDLSHYKARPTVNAPFFDLCGSPRFVETPVMFDRAVQTLLHSTLTPIAEETSDAHSYGYRPHRGVNDCIAFLKSTCSSSASMWKCSLNFKLKSVLNSVSRNWLFENIPMDTCVLNELLKLTPVSDNGFEETFENSLQGQSLYYTIVNMVLDGLEQDLSPFFQVIRYVDVFVILGENEKDLEFNALPVIKAFLEKRGLRFSQITIKHSTFEEGFEFLGFLFKKLPSKNKEKTKQYGTVLIQPTPSQIKALRARLSAVVKQHKHKPAATLITKLNQILKAWAEYYRVSTTTKCFSRINRHLFTVVWRVLRTRYGKVSRKSIVKRHFMRVGNLKWVFYGHPSVSSKDKGQSGTVTLFQINQVKSRLHPICKPFNSFDPDYYGYFKKRASKTLPLTISFNQTQKKLFIHQNGTCATCGSLIFDYDSEPTTYPIKSNPNYNDLKNLQLIHKECCPENDN